MLTHDAAFKAAFLLAPEAMLLFDDKGTLLAANAASEALFGLPAAELAGKNLAILGPGANYDFRPGIEGLIAAGSHRGELRMIRGNGEPFDAEYQSRANVVPGVHATVVRDVSDRKRIDAATKASEELFARSFINAPAALAVAAKRTGRCLLANEAFLSLTGYWRSEVIGSSSIFDRLWASTEERGQTANAHGVPTPAEWVRRDGTRRRVLAAMKTAEIDGAEASVLAAFPVE